MRCTIPKNSEHRKGALCTSDSEADISVVACIYSTHEATLSMLVSVPPGRTRQTVLQTSAAACERLLCGLMLNVRFWPEPGFFGGRRKLTLAGGSIASRVSFLAPHRTNTGGQIPPPSAATVRPSVRLLYSEYLPKALRLHLGLSRRWHFDPSTSAMCRSAVVGAKVESNDCLALQAKAASDPYAQFETMKSLIDCGGAGLYTDSF
jgi:hypothetical protein